jgi:hypothetical protein
VTSSSLAGAPRIVGHGKLGEQTLTEQLRILRRTSSIDFCAVAPRPSCGRSAHFPPMTQGARSLRHSLPAVLPNSKRGED